MSSFKEETIVPNGAAPPTNEPTKAEGVPNRMSLKLDHLPSKKDIKPAWPRTPSSVRSLVFRVQLQRDGTLAPCMRAVISCQDTDRCYAD